jgi:hypothetical protein
MATRRTATTEVVEEPVGDLGPSGVRSLEPEPDPGPDFQGVDEVEMPDPRDDMTTTQNFYTTPGVVTEVIEFEPEIVEGDEPTYRVRLTADLEPIYIGIDFPIPAMRKDVLYEVNQRVYDYLLPKGLIQGK